MNRDAKDFRQLLSSPENHPAPEWNLSVFSHSDCLSYIAWNSNTHEAIVVDPKSDYLESYLKWKSDRPDLTWLAVIDTHTHADHISVAHLIATEFGTGLFMHHKAGSSRVQFRVCQDTRLPLRSGDLHFLLTPGHTQDGMCVKWGPFLFTGDTILHGDVGRDDLPGGDPELHFDSVQKLVKQVPKDAWMCPGHDTQGGRITRWQDQLQINPALSQSRQEFVQECSAFDSNPPQLFKKSLFENLK